MRLIGSLQLCSILELESGNAAIETPWGLGIPTSAYEAYLFANSTGAVYWDGNLDYFTPQGLSKIFRSALEFKFVTGMYDAGHLYFSPRKLVESRPWIMDSPKFIVPIESFTHEDFFKKISRCETSDIFPPSSFLFLRIDTSKNGYGLENFLEYVCTLRFIKKGFVTETQVPLSHSSGSPDLIAFTHQKMQSEISMNFGFSSFDIIELSMLSFRNFGADSMQSLAQSISDIAFVGEVKVVNYNTLGQLSKYLETGFFSNGFDVRSDQRNPAYQEVGQVYLDESWKLVVDGKGQNHSSSPDEITYLNWLYDQAKFYLLGSCTDSGYEALLRQELKCSLRKPINLRPILDISLNELANLVVEIGHGSL